MQESKLVFALVLSLLLIIIPITLADIGGKVVYVGPSGTGSGFHIYTMNPDGTDVRCLTEKPGWYENPRWSPDGTRIAYNEIVYGAPDDPPEYQLWMMNADGSSPELIHNDSLWGASWSPDGKKIAFMTATNGDLVVMDLATREVDKLIELGTIPVWSPDGDAIAYEPLRLPSDRLYLVDPMTKKKWEIDLRNERLEILHKHWAPMAWSPDGEKIAFLGLEKGRNWWGIYVMDSDGSDVDEICASDGNDLAAIWPTWSPDGKQIMFETRRGIEVANIDGGPLTPINPDGFQPDWGKGLSASIGPKAEAISTWGYVKLWNRE